MKFNIFEAFQMDPFRARFLAFIRSLWVAGPAQRPPKKRLFVFLLAKKQYF
jgi:hypothetical protein